MIYFIMKKLKIITNLIIGMTNKDIDKPNTNIVPDINDYDGMGNYSRTDHRNR